MRTKYVPETQNMSLFKKERIDNNLQIECLYLQYIPYDNYPHHPLYVEKESSHRISFSNPISRPPFQHAHAPERPPDSRSYRCFPITTSSPSNSTNYPPKLPLPKCFTAAFTTARSRVTDPRQIDPFPFNHTRSVHVQVEFCGIVN